MESQKALYIGAVDDNADNLRKHVSLQTTLAEHAGSMIGVYRSEEQVLRLRVRGLEAVAADVERMNLEDTFGVIVAADNIEHLENGGLFLERVRLHLEPGGSLLVSTPNPTSFVRILELLVYRRTKANVKHTAWYTAQVLDQLARRCGLRVVEQVFIDEMHRYHAPERRAAGAGFGKTLLASSLVGLNRVICALFPQLSETFGFVLRIDDGTGS
ncbi:MAG: class I SAM-dependent methyltransferase [Planctomycetota bacterium]|jgi:SAM-dependent methyltransferase